MKKWKPPLVFLFYRYQSFSVEENESASNGTEIETFFEDVIEVKTEQILTSTSSTWPFCVGMLLGVILTVGLYGLYTYRVYF